MRFHRYGRGTGGHGNAHGGVKRRYGAYPQEKWERNLALKAYFEERMKTSLQEALSDLKKT